MKLTKELVKELHTELWLWATEYPYLEKENWPRWERNGGDLKEVSARCFPCEYKRQNREGLYLCHCVLDFPGWRETAMSDKECLGGLFNKWKSATGSKRSALAKKIANLPIR